MLPDLLHGRETRAWGDQAYRGQRAVIRQHAPKAKDFTNRRYRHRGVVDEVVRAKNRSKSNIRARVEDSIGVIKRVFGFAKGALSRAYHSISGMNHIDFGGAGDAWCSAFAEDVGASFSDTEDRRLRIVRTPAALILGMAEVAPPLARAGVAQAALRAAACCHVP